MQVLIKQNAKPSNKDIVVLFVNKTEGLEKVKDSLEVIKIESILQGYNFAKSTNLLEIKGLDSCKNLIVVKLNEEQSNAKQMEELANLLEKEQEVSFIFADTSMQASAKAVADFKIKSWNFDKYTTIEGQKKDSKIASLNVSHFENGFEEELNKELAIADGVIFASTLMNEPANKLTPALYTEEIKKLEELGVKVEILDQAQLEKLGMGCLLAVAQGSAQKPYVAIMRWENGNKDDAPIALVGKGVTFDTGGISIKPSVGMEDMKFDMGGSATVCGVLKSVALRKAKVNVVGLVGLVENMPSSTAVKPGDVVTAMNGKTVEVINTDAEGRLVLADVLYYTHKILNPKFIIDFATLTGAMIISLGSERAGFFANDDKLSKELEIAGEETNELLWRLPLGKEYDKYVVSDYADYRNISKLASRGAGSVVAAKFLEQFVGDSKWAHVDIAGVAWSSKGKRTPTSFGIKLVNDFLINNYEK